MMEPLSQSMEIQGFRYDFDTVDFSLKFYELRRKEHIIPNAEKNSIQFRFQFRFQNKYKYNVRLQNGQLITAHENVSSIRTSKTFLADPRVFKYGWELPGLVSDMLTEVGVDRVEVSEHTKAMFKQEIIDKAFDIVNKGGLMLSLGIHITCEAVYKRTQTPDELVQEQLREQQQQQQLQQQQLREQQQQLQQQQLREQQQQQQLQQQQLREQLQLQQQQHLDELDSLQQQHYDFVRYLQQRHPGYNQQLLDVYITEHTMRMSAVEASEKLKMIPASRKAIDELEKIKFDGGCETSIINKMCNICLDEFEMGLEVTRLPCSHGFHRDCITKWLETSHFCPSCRFKMPINDD